LAPSPKPRASNLPTELDEAELREREARRQVRQQQELVLTASGVDAELARETLAIFEATLHACEENTALVRARVADASETALQNAAPKDEVRTAVRKLFRRRI
jgi:hypothetical protein